MRMKDHGSKGDHMQIDPHNYLHNTTHPGQSFSPDGDTLRGDPKDAFLQNPCDYAAKDRPDGQVLKSLTTAKAAETLLNRESAGQPPVLWGKRCLLAPGTGLHYDSVRKRLYSVEDGHLTCTDASGFELWVHKDRNLRTDPALDREGNLYFRDDDGLYSLDCHGKERWSFPYPVTDWRASSGRSSVGKYARTPPVPGSDGTVYFLAPGQPCSLGEEGTVDFNPPAGRGDDRADSCVLVAVKDGKKKWEIPMVSLDSNPPDGICAGSDGTVYVPGYACAGKDPAPAIPAGTQEKLTIEPAVTAIGSDGREICTVKLEGMWNHFTPDPLTESPDGTVYAVSQNNRLTAIKPGGFRKKKWEVDLRSDKSDRSLIAHGGPVCDKEGNVYIAMNSVKTADFPPTYVGVLPGNDPGCLIKLNKNGTEEWRKNLDARVSAKPQMGPDGTIYCPTANGFVQVFDGQGSLVGKIAVGVKETYLNHKFSIRGSFAFGENNELFGSGAYFMGAFEPGEMKGLAASQSRRTGKGQQRGLLDGDLSRIMCDDDFLIIDGVKLHRKAPDAHI